ncbi:MAG: (d)CMP kinase [Bacteroidales bacterium]|nr:(d)CMP kinase [Bacteroidales bacterium]
MKLIIAVDGYSSCGKSTLARELAREFRLLYIDSGAMYRAVTLYAMQENLISENNVKVSELITKLDNVNLKFVFSTMYNKQHIFLNGEDVEEKIRSIDVASNVSAVAAIKEVRKKMVDLQRKMAENTGVVMDGRDIGTVVFPNANIKFFMQADVMVRAKRRFCELKPKNPTITLTEVAENIRSRDFQDENREISPLRKADNAILLDNSNITKQEQLKWAIDYVNNYMANES